MCEKQQVYEKGAVDTLFGCLVVLGYLATVISVMMVAISTIEYCRDPQTAFFGHLPQCVMEDGSVVVSADSIFKEAGDSPSVVRLELGEKSDVFGCEVKGLEKGGDGRYTVTLWINQYGREEAFIVSECKF